ncbi:Myo-inositol-1-phosphate synthase [Candidatus Burarchaeum australiense]|nr:Myo-inositol-1-phosphate synthase [Candidatus Burarchaeum australiense]
MGKIKLAIVGVGNCASSLVQGFQYYRKVDGNSPPTPGLMHNVLGGYKLSDVEIVAAFDVDKRKVGKDVGKAIFAQPNCTLKFSDVKPLGVEVEKGPVLDGVAETTRGSFLVDSSQRVCNVKEVLKRSGAEIVISYLPVGSDQATRFYAGEVLGAGCAFVNAIPSFIASAEDGVWAKRFERAGLPIIGDDVKSQVGATILHRVLTRLFMDRGVKLERTYQLNVGGNTDFLNMTDRSRLKSKKISKTEAVQSQMTKRLADENIHVGPSDYVPWLHDKKLCFIRMEGRKFGDVPLLIDLKLDVEDSPNSAGIMVDAIRCLKLALDRGVGGVLYSPSAYFMKHPAIQYPDSVARQMVEEFISGKRER